jgi:hypothetical protein
MAAGLPAPGGQTEMTNANASQAPLAAQEGDKIEDI